METRKTSENTPTCSLDTSYKTTPPRLGNLLHSNSSTSSDWIPVTHPFQLPGCQQHTHPSQWSGYQSLKHPSLWSEYQPKLSPYNFPGKQRETHFPSGLDASHTFAQETMLLHFELLRTKLWLWHKNSQIAVKLQSYKARTQLTEQERDNRMSRTIDSDNETKKTTMMIKSN